MNTTPTFEGIHNFRDYGGYGVADGARLRTGVLFRSGQHADATDADLVALAGLDLRTVIDLRSDAERLRHPCRRPPGFAALVVMASGDLVSGEAAPHLAVAQLVTQDGDEMTAAQAHARMAATYRVMPYRADLVAVLTDYFAALAERDGASLLHCLAGKDRTGLGVALLHALVGVHNDDIMADYLLTNRLANVPGRSEARAQMIRANIGVPMSDAAVQTLMTADAAFLDGAFDTIRTDYGDVATYAAAVLGVSVARQSALARRLLV